MLSFRLSHVARAAMTGAATLAMAATMACSDDATAPERAVSLPQNPQSMIVPRTLVTLKLTDTGGNLLPEAASARFIAGPDTVTLWDNSFYDTNKTTGIISVSMRWTSSYKACLFGDSKNYGIDVNLLPTCNTVAGGASAVDAGSLKLRKFPIAAFSLQDMNGGVVTEAEVQLIADPVTDGYMTTVQDGDTEDRKPAIDGKLWIRGNRPGTYTWCETLAPAGYLKTSPSCGTVDLHWDVVTPVTLKHQKKIIINLP
jgi:hypothetical protein